MTKRLEILQESLNKKENLFNQKLTAHMDDVGSANGQPLNDKRNGRATLNRWERQNNALRNIKEGVEKTKDAIVREQWAINGMEVVKDSLPDEILTLIDEGKITQWRKHPETFFVVGVERARLVWVKDKRMVAHRYVKEIPKGTGPFDVFRDIFNHLNNTVNKRSI